MSTTSKFVESVAILAGGSDKASIERAQKDVICDSDHTTKKWFNTLTPVGRVRLTNRIIKFKRDNPELMNKHGSTTKTPVSPAAAPLDNTARTCHCGCGAAVMSRKKSVNFIQGHDARLKGHIINNRSVNIPNDLVQQYKNRWGL